MRRLPGDCGLSFERNALVLEPLIILGTLKCHVFILLQPLNFFFLLSPHFLSTIFPQDFFFVSPLGTVEEAVLLKEGRWLSGRREGVGRDE